MATSPTSSAAQTQRDDDPSSRNKASLAASTVTYDPPPASWFFGRGSNDSPRQESPSLPSPLLAKEGSEEASVVPPAQNENATGCPSPSWGMVSDNEQEDGDAEDHEGFNFVAVSNSLLMAGRSFEQVSSSCSEQESGGYGKNRSNPTESVSSSYSKDCSYEEQVENTGVLIVDGTDNGEDIRFEEPSDPPSHKANSSENHIHGPNDASVLTIPGSDSLPSDIGTISHHDEEGEDLLFGDHSSCDDQVVGVVDTASDPREDHIAWMGGSSLPLVHRFLKNLHQESFRRLRLVSDASDEQDGGVSVVDGHDESDSSSPLAKVSRWRYLLSSQQRVLLVLVLFVASAAYWAGNCFVNRQREIQRTWEERLRLEELQMAKVLAETNRLREEMQALLEDAAMANAKAESLAKEQERLLHERQILEQAAAQAEAEAKRLKELQDEASSQQERSRYSKNGSGGFELNFEDEGNDCSGNGDGDPSSFTLADNCWFKAKASIDLGNCGDDAKDYFRRRWNDLWEDWEDFDFDYFYSTRETSDTGAVEPYSFDQEEAEQQDNYDFRYQNMDDTYYPPQDPLKDLYSVLHSAGQSFVNKMVQLVTDETETAEEDGSLSSPSSSDAVAFRGEWSKEEYTNILSTLHAMALNTNRSHGADEEASTAENPSLQQVTRKGLVDASSALASLSKAWQENAAGSQPPSMVQTSDGTGQQ